MLVADGVPASVSGAGVIVTGTRAGVEGQGAAAGCSIASRYRRRHMKTWFALTSYWRATTETDAPGYKRRRDDLALQRLRPALVPPTLAVTCVHIRHRGHILA